MAKITSSTFFTQRDHWLLLRGLLYLFVLSLPFVGFVGIMGGAAPESPGFFYSVGIVFGFMIKETLIFLLTFKLIDTCLQLRLATKTFSYFAIILGSLFYTVYANVVYDNLFQFNQGHYDISIVGLFMCVVFWAGVVAIGHIRFGKTAVPAV
jgi:hypothetical protein